MFTLIQPITALFLSVFAYFAALRYEPLFDPEADLGRMPMVAVIVAIFIGWTHVGPRLGRKLWLSMYMGIQAVGLTAIGTAMVIAVREIFVRGYRMQYDEVLEAFAGYFSIVLEWLYKGFVPEYLGFLAAGGAIIGAVLHVLFFLMERRRNDR